MAEERKSPQAPPDPRAAHPFLGRQSKCVDGNEKSGPSLSGLPSPAPLPKASNFPAPTPQMETK